MTDTKHNGWTSEQSSPRDTTYNGWSSYATWRINLEIFDGVPFIDDFEGDTYELAEYLKTMAEEYLSEEGNGLVLDYALAFISDVNWYEIAENLLNDGE